MYGILLLILLWLCPSCGPEQTSVPVPAPILTPSAAFTPTTAPTATPTYAATSVPTPTHTAPPAATSVPTGTPTSVPTPTIAPTSIPTPTPTAPPTGQTTTGVYLTFYGYDDNDDGNGHFGTAVISDPVIHSIATEDLGTYDHPSTFATDYNIAPPGTLIYVPRLKKYYIMEDTCVECTSDQRRGKTRIDLYMGGNTALQGAPLMSCQDTLTAAPYTDVVILNPSRGYPVDMIPLFSSGSCHIP